jgi:hypothetical protein
MIKNNLIYYHHVDDKYYFNSNDTNRMFAIKHIEAMRY